jgi:membrane-associated protein
MQRADRIIAVGIAVAGLYGLVLLPLVPLLGSSHPALLELVRGSTASIVNMGARASVGQTSFALAVLLGVPSVMMFDWLFWWAGRRWGDRVFIWLLGRDDGKAKRRLARMRWLERSFGPLAVVLAPVLPIPSPLIYAAVGDGGACRRHRRHRALLTLGHARPRRRRHHRSRRARSSGTPRRPLEPRGPYRRATSAGGLHRTQSLRCGSGRLRSRRTRRRF